MDMNLQINRLLNFALQQGLIAQKINTIVRTLSFKIY